MKKWKRISAVIMCVCLIISVSACSSSEKKQITANDILSALDNELRNSTETSNATNAFSNFENATSAPIFSETVTSQLVSSNQENDEYVYDVYSDHIKIKKYKGSQAVVSVPDEIDGLKVTEIEGKGNALSGGEALFKGVVSVKLPDTLTEIGAYSFYNSDIVNINIPDGVTRIDDCAFCGCSKLTGIKLPSKLTEIGEFAFCYGNRVEEGKLISDGKLIIPEEIKEIPDATFRGRLSIKEVVLPDGIEKIGNDVFYECSSLEKINFPDSLISIGNSSFYNCNISGNLHIPSSVQKIGYNCFSGNANITAIDLPENVQIGSCAFSRINKIKEITVPKGVTYFDTYENASEIFSGRGNKDEDKCLEKVTVNSDKVVAGMFDSQINLQEVFLSNDVVIIENCAFREVSPKCKVHIPESVISIDNNIFDVSEYEENYFTIYGKKNSVAEEFAKEHNIKFIEE